jgi:hypothetical protein
MLSKLSDFSLYIGVNTLLLPCFIENKTVQKNSPKTGIAITKVRYWNTSRKTYCPTFTLRQIYYQSSHYLPLEQCCESVPDSAYYLNANPDPDQGSQTNADPQKVEFLQEKYT